MESLMPSIIQDHSVGPGVYSLPPLIPEGPSYSFAQAGRFFTPTNQVKISFSSITPEKYREGSRPSHRSPDLKNKSKSVPNDLFFKRALFEISESPGPGQYNLPSTLYNKDFQLKGKFKEPKGQDTPGPGTYNSDLQEKKGFALLKDSRLKPEISPTANVDFCLPKLRNGSPSYSFGKRAKSPKISDIPGPGSYNLPSVSEPAKITIANRIKSPEPLKTPGPGTYTVSASKNSQEFSLGLPLKSQIHLSPGPGDYDVEHKNPGPFYSFGTKSELKQELDNRDFSDLPSTFDGKAAVLIGKPKIDHSNCSPGPGAYNPQLLRTNLMFSQSKSPREGKIQMSPGPGDYESPLKPIGPFYSLGHKIHSSEPEVSPGPGHYDLSRTERIKSPLLRGKPKNENPSKVPGPGAYYPNKTFTCIAYTNGNDSRFKDIEKTPGPGDFHSELKVQGPKFSFTGREKSSFEVKSDTPGPGSYMLPSTISKLAAKICGKRTEEKPNDVPGPGAYINNELDMPRNKGFSMGKGERHDSSSFSKNIPGPGTYESERAKSVGYSFGKDLRSSELHDDVPGPGSYDWKAIDNSKKFTMTGKEVRKDSSLAPGPGAYSAEVKPSSASYSFGIKFVQKYENSVPGPGAYTQVRKSLSPAWTFGSRNKELFGKHEESPGPGAYTLPVPKVVTAKISKSHSVTPIKETPGPGSYIMDPHNFFSNPISYHPGNSNRTDFTRSFQDLPGPGSYNLNSSLNKIGGKISPEGRSKQQNLTENFPGPGTYDPKLPENSSSFSLAGKKNPEKIPDFPGPGSYSVKSEKVPSFSIGKKIDQKNTTNGPGPGSYKIPNKPISPAWTFKSRLFPKPKEEGPGPGQYYLTSMLNSKGFSFSKFEEKPLKNNLPGPGQYATEKPRFESPGFSLGKGPRTDFAKLRSETPGPRAYDSFLNTSLSKISTKFSKAKRPNFSNAEDSAGFYKIDLKPEGPFYSIQGKANLKNTEKTPGPGQYDASFNNKTVAPAYTMAPKREIYSKLTKAPKKTFTPIRLNKNS